MHEDFLELQETVILFVHNCVTTTSRYVWMTIDTLYLWDDQLHEFQEVRVRSLVCSAAGRSSRKEPQTRVGISYTVGVRWEGRACVAPTWVWKVLLL